jgi:hypothetical protein
MKAINWAQDQALLRSPFLGLKPVLMYVLIRGRNAWHSQWVRHYRGPAALVTDLEDAKSAAEEQRVQGSVFYILEVPGLSLLSEAGPVALVEFHSANCFGKWKVNEKQDILRLGTPIAHVLNSLGPNGAWRKPIPEDSSFISGIARWGTIHSLPPRVRLRSFESQAQGSSRYLHWIPRSNHYSRRGVNAIARAFAALNSEQDRAQNEDRYWSIADRVIEREEAERKQRLDESREHFEAILADIIGVDGPAQ